MLTSCHCEHEEDDGLLSSLQVGNVVCSDGNILSMDKFKQSDKEAVAIVFHVNRSAETDNLGYAVYIHDMEPHIDELLSAIVFWVISVQQDF